MHHGTPLLDEEGHASMATALLCTHHAFRRDLARFARALENPAIAPLRAEWQLFRGALHGHHLMEDSRIFPHLIGADAMLAPAIAELTADHHRLDPLLAKGDRAFAELPAGDAASVIRELTELVDAHLRREESVIVPALRAAREMPAPTNEQEAELYAQGFAWSTQGVAPDVLEKIDDMLAPVLREKLPDARVAFEKRCAAVWGHYEVGATHTSVPGR
jgi:hypothetical protein